MEDYHQAGAGEGDQASASYMQAEADTYGPYNMLFSTSEHLITTACRFQMCLVVEHCQKSATVRLLH